MTRQVKIANFSLGGGAPLLLIAGPCVIESEELTERIAERLKALAERLSFPLVFKASYDKANRTSLHSFRGPGLEKGLEILSRIKKKYALPILSDVHCCEEVPQASEVLDVLQIPAFLSRQTDLIQTAARTGKPINIKKGQFLAPWDVKNIAEKVEATGNRDVFFTERGVSFGYNNLVSDFRAIPMIQELGYPVIIDGTHSVQLPGGLGTRSGGQQQYVPHLTRAAVAAGADGVFLEVHESPEKALCDGPNMLSFEALEVLLGQLLRVRQAIAECGLPGHSEPFGCAQRKLREAE